MRPVMIFALRDVTENLDNPLTLDQAPEGRNGSGFAKYTNAHKSLNKLTPAMAAGITDTLWSLEDIAEQIEADRPAPGKRGPYKTRQAALR